MKAGLVIKSCAVRRQRLWVQVAVFDKGDAVIGLGRCHVGSYR